MHRRGPAESRGGSQRRGIRLSDCWHWIWSFPHHRPQHRESRCQSLLSAVCPGRLTCQGGNRQRLLCRGCWFAARCAGKPATNQANAKRFARCIPLPLVRRRCGVLSSEAQVACCGQLDAVNDQRNLKVSDGHGSVTQNDVIASRLSHS